MGVIVSLKCWIRLIEVDTACVHNKLRGKWYVFDDSRVSQCEDTSVVVVFNSWSHALIVTGTCWIHFMVQAKQSILSIWSWVIGFALRIDGPYLFIF